MSVYSPDATFSPADFRPLLDFVRERRKAILDESDPLSFCLALIAATEGSPIVAQARSLLEGLDADVQDYAVSSAYARLIGEETRKSLSAYFTPPALARATLEAIFELVGDAADLRVLDPACGGGSFLVPTARMLIERRVAAGANPAETTAAVLRGLQGIEIDAGLARLSAALLARMVKREWDLDVDTGTVVLCADALTATLDDRYQLAIGNPPYSKVWRAGAERIKAIAGRADRGGHTNLYGLFVIRALDWLVPGGGLAFVLPTSFVAGPYFAGLREEILARAHVVRLDIHLQREDLFLDATQDVCLLVLRRHGEATANAPDPYVMGVIDAAGQRTILGTADAPAGGEPWTLPVPATGAGEEHRQLVGTQPAATLNDYGYRMRVGKVVPTREGACLFRDPADGRLPVLWASDVRPDGGFQFQGGTRTANAAWYAPLNPERVPYASFGRSVLVQRTSNRDQQRRLNAAAVSPEFADRHAIRGYVAENHVIVIEPIPGQARVAPETLAAILNSDVVNRRFSAVSGSFSVSARLLARLALPPAENLPQRADDFEAALAPLFDALDGILVAKPSKPQGTTVVQGEPLPG